MDCVIIGSGKGSNAHSILQTWRKKKLGKANIRAIFSDNVNAPILRVAEEFSVPSHHIRLDQNSATISPKDTNALIGAIEAYSPHLIVLAGFMKILPLQFIKNFNEKIINIHPSLLPSFKGLHAIKRAFEHGVKISGCTIHWVTKDVDAGRIIAQAPVRVMDTDSVESLTQKIQAAEHFLLPTVISNLSLEAAKKIKFNV